MLLLFLYNKDVFARDKDVTPVFEGNPGPYHVAYPRNYKFIQDQSRICYDHNPFLVVIVPVAPHNQEARDTIRKTWGNDSLVQEKKFLVLFLLGLPSGANTEKMQEMLSLENQRHQDLIQANFTDSYRNLTIKTMMMLEWLASYCDQALYAVKVDSDILLNLRNLVKILPKVPKDYMTGLVWWHSVVLRDPSNKFYLPYDVYQKPEYPPYPLGMCYVISLDLPAKLLKASRQIKPIYIEDAYLGMCLEKLGVKPTNSPNPTDFVVVPPDNYDRCFYASTIAIMTKSSAELTKFWTDLNRFGYMC
ncbi:beta-1,3-galactosyltransferase 2-like [Chanos chanos]|uniref:Hexosyltransferase n=1 Tax=Chanos chanos TaxID=29144 RepID=A0A6J2W077_CHACN|nr:beta-1,3-galactosyltransferase 2-like [Chanos chanos]